MHRISGEAIDLGFAGASRPLRIAGSGRTREPRERTVKTSRRANPVNDEPAFWSGGHAPQLKIEVLPFVHLIGDATREEMKRKRHVVHCDPFPWTPMAVRPSTASLRDERERIRFPISKSFRPERFRMVPYLRVVVHPINVQ